MVLPSQSLWHLMPKWLLPFTASLDWPELDSSMPCARVMLAGMPVRFISLTARSEYRLIYSRVTSLVAPRENSSARRIKAIRFIVR